MLKKNLKKLDGAGETAQFVKQLPQKQEVLSLITRSHLKKLDLVVCASNPAHRKWRQVDVWASLASQPSQISKLQANKRPCLKKKKSM